MHSQFGIHSLAFSFTLAQAAPPSQPAMTAVVAAATDEDIKEAGLAALKAYFKQNPEVWKECVAQHRLLRAAPEKRFQDFSIACKGL